jgi:hypothetical protein
MQKPKESKFLEDKKDKRKTISTISNVMVVSQKTEKKTIFITDSIVMDVDKPLVTNMTFYLERENKVLIQHYGPDLYDYSRELENPRIPFDYLKRHKLEPQTRTKMVDWIMEVLYAYGCDHPTFFLTVHIMDLFLAKTKTPVSNLDIHLIGIVALFIASKMEDLIPLRMEHVTEKVSHNKFNQKQIKTQEKLMLETIKFDIMTTSTYDFIKTFIFDFCHNNKEFINMLNLHWIIDLFDTTAVYLAKLMAHTEELTQYK